MASEFGDNFTAAYALKLSSFTECSIFKTIYGGIPKCAKVRYLRCLIWARLWENHIIACWPKMLYRNNYMFRKWRRKLTKITEHMRNRTIYARNIV